MVIIEKNMSNDDKSCKVLQQTGEYVTETGVFDDGSAVHLCLSSQLGCTIGCKMCYNGVNKNYHGNLTAKDIFLQAENIVKDFSLTEKYDVIYFSFMGVGEPLLNYENVMGAIRMLDQAYPGSGFALATTLPQKDRINDLIRDFFSIENFKLTISLHAATDEKRKELIPTHTSLQDLRDAMELYKQLGGHKCEWNYVLLKGFNDSDDDFRDLLSFLNPNDRVKVSSYNPIVGCSFEKSDRTEVLLSLLKKHEIHCSKFESVGDSIGVGCGQMAAKQYKLTSGGSIE